MWLPEAPKTRDGKKWNRKSFLRVSKPPWNSSWDYRTWADGFPLAGGLKGSPAKWILIPGLLLTSVTHIYRWQSPSFCPRCTRVWGPCFWEHSLFPPFHDIPSMGHRCVIYRSGNGSEHTHVFSISSDFICITWSFSAWNDFIDFIPSFEPSGVSWAQNAPRVC